MIGDAFREASVLIMVFGCLDTAHAGRLGMVMGISLTLFITGVVLERFR
jgi:hypothetical protein